MKVPFSIEGLPVFARQTLIRVDLAAVLNKPAVPHKSFSLPANKNGYRQLATHDVLASRSAGNDIELAIVYDPRR